MGRRSWSSGGEGNRTCADSFEESALPPRGGAESGALAATDPVLARLIEAWVTQPEQIRRAMVALLGSADGQSSQPDRYLDFFAETKWGQGRSVWIARCRLTGRADWSTTGNGSG